MPEPAWKCPGCGLTCELPRDRIEDAVVYAGEENSFGSRAFRLRRIICPNLACRQLQVSVSMHLLWQDGGKVRAEPEPMQSWPLGAAADCVDLCRCPGGGQRWLPHRGFAGLRGRLARRPAVRDRWRGLGPELPRGL